MARISSSTSATRIEVSWRQPQRSQPTNPSRGCATPSSTGAAESMWSAGRSGSDAAEDPSWPVRAFVAPALFAAFFAPSEGEDDTAHHRRQSRHDLSPHAGHHQHAESDEQRAADDVDRADVAPQEGGRRGRPAEAEGDQK